MKENADRVIRLHTVENGEIVDMKNEFDISDLAGEVPRTGDFIVDPMVLVDQDRKNPKNRRIYEVKSRYFLPHAHGEETVYVAVVVEERPATMNEFCIACVS